jgi:ABC-2 type transport system ATP-binding protein
MEDGTRSTGKHNAVIRVSNLTKRFGDVMAVDGLSFEVRRGEVFGFLGPNGAGKTTTINLICGLGVPTAGEISILSGAEIDQNEVKYRIGICPQENIYWPKLSGQEQLTFMGEMYGMEFRAAQRRAAELLAWLGLTENANVLASKLSGGMKRRLNICFALMHDPEILILDEPEAGLDPQSRLLVRDTIRSLAKSVPDRDGRQRQKTVILTTHNMDEADRLADRVAIIDHGKLLQLDTPERLKKSIGAGDVVEIKLDLDRASPEALSGLVAEVSKTCSQVTLAGGAIIARSNNVIDRVPDITDCIKDQGFKIEGITLRENTLEDVFIHLTGRKLRQ